MLESWRRSPDKVSFRPSIQPKGRRGSLFAAMLTSFSLLTPPPTDGPINNVISEKGDLPSGSVPTQNRASGPEVYGGEQMSNYGFSGKVLINGRPCTGSLLRRGETYDYILTSYHCIPDLYIVNGEPEAIELPVPGTYSYSPNGNLLSPRSTTTAIRGVIISPEPSQTLCKLDIPKGLPGCAENDMAVLVVDRGIVAPLIKIPKRNTSAYGANVYLTGFGRGSSYESMTYTGSIASCGNRISGVGVICLSDRNGNVAGGDSGAPGIVFFEEMVKGKIQKKPYALGVLSRAEPSINGMLVNPILSDINSLSNVQLIKYVNKFEEERIPMAKAQAPVYHTIQKNGPVYAVKLVSSGSGLPLPGDANTNVTLSQPDNAKCFVHATGGTQRAPSGKSKVNGKILTTISDSITSPLKFVLTPSGTDCIGHEVVVVDVSVSSRDLGDLQLRSSPISPDNDRLKPSQSSLYFPLITQHPPSAREILDKQGFKHNEGTHYNETWNK
ncbi:MAG: hypothetical protein WCJ70_01910 [bacterium]